MAEFRDLIATSDQYAAVQKDLNKQLAEMKANLASMGISVDSIKATELMTYFANDNYNHSIEPVPFQIGTKSSGDPLYGVSSQPLTADLVNEGLKFRNPNNPSEILTGTYKPYAATAIHTFELKDMNQSEASFSFHYPTLVGMPDVTVFPKEIVFLGPDGQFMLYRNSNFGIGMMYGTDNSKMTNFVVKKQRYWWNGTPYMSSWSSKQGESLSYYDHNTKRMTLLFPDEVYCMEMLDTEWQVYTCFDYTAPTGSLEPKAAPTYKWVGSELSISGMRPTNYYRDLQIVDEKVRAIKTDGKIIAVSDNLSNTSFKTYGTDKMNIVTDWSSLSVGSTFFLGKYQVGSETPWDIEWEIVHQESNYQIAMAKQIIDLRSFDAKEPNNSDSNRQNSGNNNWGVSNIEQWLNSDQSNWYSAQHSADAPPSSANVWVNNNVAYNPYDTKPGFLYYWTDEEKAVLQDMTLTLANTTVDGGGSYTWTGKIWLPTYTQMSGKQNNSISEGTKFSKFTDNASRKKTIHAMCAANNQYCIDKSKTEGAAWNYWMSSAHPSNSYDSRAVGIDGNPDRNGNAYYGNGGLAPCIRIPR